MEIYSETGYLIIMDPHYLQLGDKKKITSINLLKNPKQAGVILEKFLFSGSVTNKIGLIILSDEPGKYSFDFNEVSFWDVEDQTTKRRTIFGVELGSFIIFDVKYIYDLILNFDKLEFDRVGEKAYFDTLNRKISTDTTSIIWWQSHVGIGDGWHEIKWNAFKKI